MSSTSSRAGKLEIRAPTRQISRGRTHDEGSIEVIRGIVQGQFADFQNPSLEAEIVAVAQLIRPAQMKKCHQYWKTSNLRLKRARIEVAQ